MKGISSKLFYTLGVALLCGNLHAQSLAEAKKLYEEGKYAEAKPAFERLVKQAPNNSSYNQWYGVCCYETGDLAGAEKHLAKAVKRKVQESYRYMAEVYYQTYRFDQAVEMLEEYIAILNKKKKDPQAFEARLEEAENAQRMVEKAEDVQIIDSLVVDKADFLSAYTLSEESGTLATYQDFFQTPDTVRSTVYENQKGDKIYYAKPAEDGHYYLFTQSLLMDKWGDEKTPAYEREQRGQRQLSLRPLRRYHDLLRLRRERLHRRIRPVCDALQHQFGQLPRARTAEYAVQLALQTTS